ncbi:MAG TPA: glycosyltransferase 87 family protein [Pilimelia sp.]|nr:glycosyltransferase 87 family protein [Pilimelia sp.]
MTSTDHAPDPAPPTPPAPVAAARGAAGGAARRRWTAVAVLAVAVAGFLALTLWWNHWFDLHVYHGAMRHWVREGGQLYDYVKPGSRYGFTYPPFAAYVMAPLAFVPAPLLIAASVLGSALAARAVLGRLLGPFGDRLGQPRWWVLTVGLLLLAALEPVRETVTFGQVNLLLLGVVAADLLLLVARDSRWAGVGIGLATAVKLTPGVFLVYLLVTRRWRALGVATGTAAAATLLPGALTPDTARAYWTDAVWNTDRIGVLTYASNQSLQGLVARLDPPHPNRLLWLVLVAAAVGYWAWRVSRPDCDVAAGLALTGVLGCLVSPVTWVHHLVWLLPALLLCAGYAWVLPPRHPRRRWWLGGVAVLYALLCSRLVWAFEGDFGGLDGFLGGNAYVWAGVALLVAVPAGHWRPEPARAPAGVAPAR